MSPSKKNDDTPLIPKLKEIIETTPFYSPAEYMHKDWQIAVTVGQPNRVISKFTLKEITDAFISQEKISISYVTNYHLGIATESYRRTYKPDEVIPPENEQHQFLVPLERGGNAVLIELSEVVDTLDMKVVSIKRREKPQYPKKEATNDEYWSATLTKTSYSERNYNAGWDEWTTNLTIHCQGGVFIWGQLPK